MEKIIIETYGAHGTHQGYQVFFTAKLKIGRGYDNDVIIDDPYVSVEHLTIEKTSEGWTAVDLSSRNGTFIKDQGPISKQKVLQSGDEIAIGKTRLRFVLPHHPVAPARRFTQTSAFQKRVRHPLYAAWMVLVVVFMQSFEWLMEQYELVFYAKFIPEAMALVLVLVVWAGIWAFVGRLMTHRARFYAHLTVACFVVFAVDVFQNIPDYLGFFFSAEWLAGILGGLLSLFTFSVLLSWHLNVGTHLARKKQVLISGIISVVIIVLIFIVQFAVKEEFYPDPRYYAALKPFIGRWAPSQSPQEFLKDSETLFQDQKP